MKAVMLSIQPKWIELIASGKKTVEVRKTKPKIDVPFKCYIYCTMGKDLLTSSDGIVNKPNTIVFDLLNGSKIHELNGKVIGEFVCNAIISHCEMANADIAEYQGCIKREKLLEYANGKELYGWHITDLVIYDKPKEVREFYQKCKSYDKDEWENDDCLECENPCGNGGKLYLKRPPQSWCYCEELKGEN